MPPQTYLTRKFPYLLVLILLLSRVQVFGQVRLPRLVSERMVLQRDAKTRIWGWATAGEKVRVTFKGKSYRTTTDANGMWAINLAHMKAGAPHTMDIQASNQITIKDLLLGDVYLCSGQSNIVHQMALHNITYASDIATAHYPHIRHFAIPSATNLPVATNLEKPTGICRGDPGKLLIRRTLLIFPPLLISLPASSTSNIVFRLA